MTNFAIHVENLSKRYRLGQRERYKTLRDTLARVSTASLHALRRRGSKQSGAAETFWALRNVSFEVKEGEVLGIIGRNGAGKSTLLKILSRITDPTEGSVMMHGRVGSLLEVGTGFHPELTGRENVYLNGAILGMKRKEIDRRFDEIVQFAGIEGFLDTPVKRYSSGMYVRLAFAVAAHLEPEILVIDEVLAVGDATFQRKCLGKMQNVAKAGRTVLFVSHNLGMIQQLCPNSIWLDAGALKDIGSTPSIVAAYLRSCALREGIGENIFSEDKHKVAQWRNIKLLDSEGVVTQSFDCDKPIVIELILQIHRCMRGFYGYLEIRRSDGICVMMSDSSDTKLNPLEEVAVGLHNIRITIPARILGPGSYDVYLALGCTTTDNLVVDAPGIVSSFTLDDLTSKRGNTRPGFLSTLLNWEALNDGSGRIASTR